MSRRRIAGIAASVIMLVLAAFGVLQQEPASQANHNASTTVVAVVDESVETEIDATGDVQGVSHTDVETNATVRSVADGDTFTVQFDTGEEARIRMLGVDTPETVDPRKPVQCFGKEASAFTKRALTDARVRLEPDPQADERDIYGRLLRNVITEDGVDLNAQLVAEGFAHAYLSFPLDPLRKKQLADLEAEAKAAGRGLWGETCTNL